jgi:uncharacterized membrane protein YccC
MEKDAPIVTSAVEQLDQSYSQHVPVLRRFFRGTLVQVLIVGLVSCMNPGIWNALNSETAESFASQYS